MSISAQYKPLSGSSVYNHKIKARIGVKVVETNLLVLIGTVSVNVNMCYPLKAFIRGVLEHRGGSKNERAFPIESEANGCD